MCTVFIDISIDFSNCTPRLIPWLNTHDPSLRNSNQDECEPAACVIPGPFCFYSQEQDKGVSAWVDRSVQ